MQNAKPEPQKPTVSQTDLERAEGEGMGQGPLAALVDVEVDESTTPTLRLPVPRQAGGETLQKS
jgi:hypothetical protein